MMISLSPTEIHMVIHQNFDLLWELSRCSVKEPFTHSKENLFLDIDTYRLHIFPKSHSPVEWSCLYLENIGSIFTKQAFADAPFFDYIQKLLQTLKIKVNLTAKDIEPLMFLAASPPPKKTTSKKKPQKP